MPEVLGTGFLSRKLSQRLISGICTATKEMQLMPNNYSRKLIHWEPSTKANVSEAQLFQHLSQKYVMAKNEDNPSWIVLWLAITGIVLDRYNYTTHARLYNYHSSILVLIDW